MAATPPVGPTGRMLPRSDIRDQAKYGNGWKFVDMDKPHTCSVCGFNAFEFGCVGCGECVVTRCSECAPAPRDAPPPCLDDFDARIAEADKRIQALLENLKEDKDIQAAAIWREEGVGGDDVFRVWVTCFMRWASKGNADPTYLPPSLTLPCDGGCISHRIRPGVRVRRDPGYNLVFCEDCVIRRVVMFFARPDCGDPDRARLAHGLREVGFRQRVAIACFDVASTKSAAKRA